MKSIGDENSPEEKSTTADKSAKKSVDTATKTAVEAVPAQETEPAKPAKKFEGK